MNEPMNPKPGERWLTRGGQIARLYADDGSEPYLLHGAVEEEQYGGWSAKTWKQDGKCYSEPSPLDLIRRYDWRLELAPIWAVLKPEYRWIAMDESGDLWCYTLAPKREERQFYDSSAKDISFLRMPTPDCPWYETLTERPEGT